jgi:hypothetical protein
MWSSRCQNAQNVGAMTRKGADIPSDELQLLARIGE